MIESTLRQAASSNSQSFEAQYALGSFYASRDRLSEAVAYLEKARRIQPEHYACGYDLALAYFKSGENAKARDQIHEMLARQDLAELHNLLGAVEEAAGDPTVAAKELQRAAEMDPSEKNIFDFGNILLRYRAYDGALKIISYGVERYPRSAQLKVAHGAALYSAGRYDEAVEALCQAVDLNPADGRALYFLGKMYDISPALATEVTRRLENFARLYPDNAAANYYYAMSLWKGSGQEASANLGQVEELLKKAVALDRELYEAQFQLGALYDRLNQDADAIRQYELAVKIKPDFDTAYYRLGQAYQRGGQKARAEQAFETYRKLHKDNRAEQEQQKPPALILK